MNRLTASLIALGLAVAAAPAAAQSYPATGYGDAPYGAYPEEPTRSDGYGAQYDYARVVRVDPVLQSGYGNDGYGAGAQRCYTRRDGYAGNDGSYGNDAYTRPDDYRGDEAYRNPGSQTGRTIATVLGGVLGAAIGSQVGGGSARYATSAIGSMVGGMAGRQVYEANQRTRYPQSGAVTVCDPVPAGDGRYYPAGERGVEAYDVTYEYAGRRYTTRTNYHPGDRIRVRVDVRPG